jgi:hypothetical protein
MAECRSASTIPPDVLRSGNVVRAMTARIGSATPTFRGGPAVPKSLVAYAETAQSPSETLGCVDIHRIQIMKPATATSDA